MSRISISSHRRILGLDPALRTFGFAVLEQRESELVLLRLGLIKTQEREELSVSESNFDAAQILACKLATIVDMYQIGEFRAEAMSFPPSASSAGKISYAWGVLATVAFWCEKPLKQASPQSIRKALGLPKRSAKEKKQGKDDVVRAMEERFGKDEIARLFKAEGITRKDDRQHPIDALAAAVAIR